MLLDDSDDEDGEAFPDERVARAGSQAPGHRAAAAAPGVSADEGDAGAGEEVELIDEEEEDDEEYARRLMREESMMAYRQLQQASVEMALAAMQGQGADEMDEDMRMSLQLMQQEVQHMHGGTEQGLAAMVEASEAAAEADGGAAPDGLGYDDLLRLGEQLGDVKQDRWRARAADVVKGLPVGAWSGKGEAMCAICRCDWEEGDADVMRLPCGHEFHDECSTQWLKDHDTCPICKASIDADAVSPASRKRPASAMDNSEDVEAYEEEEDVELVGEEEADE